MITSCVMLEVLESRSLLTILVAVGIADLAVGEAIAAPKRRAKKRTNGNILRAV